MFRVVPADVARDDQWTDAKAAYLNVAVDSRSSHSAANAGSAAATAILATPAQKVVTDASGHVTAGTVGDKTGYSLADGAITADKIAADAIDADALAASAVTEIQSGLSTLTAKQVWEYTSRTLSNFGTLVADVWAALTSGMTTDGSIGKKLADWVLGTDSKVLLSADAQTGVTIPTVTNVTNPVTAGTVTDKAGYALTAAYDLAKTAAQAGDQMALVDNAVSADAVSADAVTEIQAGLGTSANQTTLLNRLTEVRAGYLDAAVSSRSSHTAQEAGEEAASLILDTWTAEKAGYLDAAISSRSSHTAEDAGEAAASAILITPANKLGTDAEGRAEIDKAEHELAASTVSAVAEAAAGAILATPANKVATDAEGRAEIDKTDHELAASSIQEVGEAAASAILLAPANKLNTDTEGRAVIDKADHELAASSITAIDDALSNAHGAGAWESGVGGGGANTVTITVTSEDAEPLPGAFVTVKNEAQTTHVAGPLMTDADGEAVFGLDDGTYALVITSTARYLPANPYTLVVSGTTELTCEVATVALSTPSDPDNWLLWGVERSVEAGQPLDGVKVAVVGVSDAMRVSAETDSAYLVLGTTTETDANGQWSIEVPKALDGARVSLRKTTDSIEETWDAELDGTLADVEGRLAWADLSPSLVSMKG